MLISFNLIALFIKTRHVFKNKSIKFGKRFFNTGITKYFSIWLTSSTSQATFRLHSFVIQLLQRGLRQGCPLSLPRYIIQSEITITNINHYETRVFRKVYSILKERLDIENKEIERAHRTIACKILRFKDKKNIFRKEKLLKETSIFINEDYC